jgi:hypothetical protein
MVVSFVIIGELWLMLISSAGSRGVRLGPQNVETRWRTPSVRTMLALKTMRILAAKMLSLFPGPRAFSLLLCTVGFREVRLFLRKSRVESGCLVYARSENAVAVALHLPLLPCGVHFVDVAKRLTNTSVLCAKRRP